MFFPQHGRSAPAPQYLCSIQTDPIFFLNHDPNSSKNKHNHGPHIISVVTINSLNDDLTDMNGKKEVLLHKKAESSGRTLIIELLKVLPLSISAIQKRKYKPGIKNGPPRKTIGAAADNLRTRRCEKTVQGNLFF